MIHISSITVRDTDLIEEGTWKKYTLSLSSQKNYDVNVFVDEKQNVYLKPIICYFESEFERIFNLGNMCRNFDTNKTVLVVRPNDFHKNFIRS